LLQTVSSISVMIASSALRQGVLAGVRKRFLANCCEIVEPPATTRPFFWFILDRLLDAFPVEAFVIDEFGVFGGDDRALEIGRDAVVATHCCSCACASATATRRGESHETRTRRVDPVPPEHPAEKPELVEQQQGDAPAAAASAPRRIIRHRPRSWHAQRQSPAPVGAEAAPEMEGFGRLLDEHAETVGQARRALRSGKGAGMASRLTVHHVVSQAAGCENARGQRWYSPPARLAEVALITRSKDCPASSG
jgi:hypothetical protein